MTVVAQTPTSRGIDALSSTRTLVSGVLWNGLGRGLPVLIALATTPLLLHRLGVDRWALYTLALSIAGSFGILDFGIGAALTRALAERIGTDDEAEAAPLIVAALVVLTLCGTLGGGMAAWFAPTLVDELLNVPPHLRLEAIAAFRLLAACGPLIVITAALWGVLSAYQSFRAATLVNVPVNVLYYLGPVVVLWFSNNLIGVIAMIVAARLVQVLTTGTLVLQLVPALRGVPHFEAWRLRDLLRIGAWVTVSSTLWPVMLYLDRFIIGAVLTLAAVTYYTTPLDLVLRMLMAPMAVAATLFPAVATSSRSRPERAGALLGIGSAVTIVVTFPACVLLATFGHSILTLWLGAGFAESSKQVLAILTAGMFFNCVAVLPGTYTDAVGRPEIGGIIMLLQVTLFPPLVYLAASHWGIEGAAMIWTMRAMMNCAARLVVCRRFGGSVAPVAGSLALVTLTGTAALIACLSVDTLSSRAILAGATGIGVPALAILLLLDSNTSASLRRSLAQVNPFTLAARRFHRT